MKHEMMLRAIGEIDDDLVAQAYICRAKAHKRRALPRMLAAAACLALILTAAFTASRNAERNTLYIGGTALTGAPVPIDSPAPLPLDGRSMDTPPLCVALSIESRSGDALTVSVSEGVLDSPADSSPRALSSRSAASGEALTWTVEAPDENTRYTLSLDGKAAAVLRYDGAKGCWVAERP